MDLGSASPPRTIWAVSDGRAGIKAQAVGLAEAVARRTGAQVTVKTLAWRGAAGRLPWFALPCARSFLTADSQIKPPWPDLWIGCGRASVPASIGVRRWSRGRTFVVQLQNPRAPSGLFDLVAPPTHDRMKGRNVFSILGSPHRTTPQRLAQEAADFAGLIDSLPRPHVVVLIGGRSKAHHLPADHAAALADQIATAAAAKGGSILATMSRRTPADAAEALTRRLSDLPGHVWSGQGPNPYFAFLAAADHILVTEDSVNMAAEAASTGKPVHILSLPGGAGKFRRFHADLAAHGAARPFDGSLDDWTYPPLDETGRLADEIVRRMAARA